MKLQPILLSAGLLLALFQANEAAAFPNCGKASWYALKSRTASGEMMDASKMTAAHPSLPFGTLLKVTNVSNGQDVYVRINDRGPFSGKRILDLSKAAARQLSFVSKGVTKVCIKPVTKQEAAKLEAMPLPRKRPNLKVALKDVKALDKPWF